MAELKIYPHLDFSNNKNPNKLYAFPFIGIFIKVILLIPVFIELAFLGFVGIFVLIINWFVVSFTSKYWDSAYKFFLGVMRLTAKTKLYILGLSDKYPGFTFQTQGIVEFDIPKPEKPNIWLAIPIVGIAVRGILLIPYFIFSETLDRGTGIAFVISWFAVTFKNKFPESIYEFEKDSLRVGFSYLSYMLGLSDQYPSFKISMDHQTVKLLLIIAGAILTAWRMEQGLLLTPLMYTNQLTNSNYNSTYTPPTDTNYTY